MAVLFPRLRRWKNRISRAVAGRLRSFYCRIRLRGTGLGRDLRLKVAGVTTADAAIYSGSSGESVRRWLIHPAAMAELPLPKTIEQHDEGGFAPWRTFPRPAAYVYRFPGGLYHGELGAVLDHRLRVLGDLLDAPPDLLNDNHLDQLFPPKTEPHFCDGDAVALSASQNYYHWLLKMLPRLDLAAATDVDPRRCEALLINQPTAAQAEGYTAAGLQTDVLRVMKSQQFLCCRHLYVTSIPHDLPVWSVQYLRRTFASLLAASPDGPKAIYLRRGHSPTRRVRNEDEVCAHLSARGVTALDFSERSFREQVSIVASADVIIAPHGAALANLAFARRGTRVLELFANAENQKCYWMLACHRGAIYHYVVGQAIPRGENSNKFDMIMPLEKLDRALDFLLHDSGSHSG